MVSALAISVMGGGAVQSAEQQLDNALEEERDSGDLVAQHDYTDITSYFKDDGTGNPSVGEVLDGCTILDSSQFGGKTAAQWIAGLDELVTNGGFDSDTSWTKNNSATISGGVGNLTASNDAFKQDLAGLSDGDSVLVVVDLNQTSSGAFRIYVGGVLTYNEFYNTAGASQLMVVLPWGATSDQFEVRSAGWVGTVDNASVKHLPGNHTVASGTGPTLRQTSGMYYTETNGTDDALTMALPARRNLLTYTEDFSNAAWVETAVGSASAPVQVGDLVSGPLGSINAQRIQFSLGGNTGTGDISLFRQSNTTTGALTFSVYLRSFDGSSSYIMQIVDPTGAAQSVTVTGSWQRFEVTATAAGTINYGIRLRGGVSPVNSDSADVLIAAPQLETGSTATDYQSIGSDWMDDMMVSIAFRTSDTQGMLVNSDNVIRWLGAFSDSDVSADTIGFGSGSPVMRLDGVAVTPANRDALHALVSDGDWHVATISAADLSSWSDVVLAFYSASSAWNASSDIVGLVVAPNTTENIELAEAALAKAMEPVGYALAA